MLTLTEPQAESSGVGTELAPFLQEYEAMLSDLDRELAGLGTFTACGRESADCCRDYFELQLAESVWIHTHLNRLLSQDDRQRAIERALECSAVIKTVRKLHAHHPKLTGEDFSETYAATRTLCPLSVAGKCMLFAGRPFRCRWRGSSFAEKRKEEYSTMLVTLSQNMYLALTGAFPPESVLQFSIADTVSGRFVQACFAIMRNRNGADRGAGR